MKIILAVASAFLATGAVAQSSMPSTAQPVEHHDSHTTMTHSDMHMSGNADSMRHHAAHRVCRTQWRHHHRVRVCRTVRD